MLPAKEFHGLWENLVYDSGVKVIYNTCNNLNYWTAR